MGSHANRCQPAFKKDVITGCQVHSSAPLLATEVASLIKKVTLALRSHIRGLGTGTKLKSRSPRKKCWFYHIIAKYYVLDLGDVEVVGFPVQNVYKMTYGDENATFEPLNP